MLRGMDKRDEVVVIRVNAAERAMLVRAVSVTASRSVADFVRKCASAYAMKGAGK
jgi:uncharacterized protein (DUF1778 family)